MVQTIGRCHVPLLKNVKTFAFWGNMTKNIKKLLFLFFFVNTLSLLSNTSVFKIHFILKT